METTPEPERPAHLLPGVDDSRGDPGVLGTALAIAMLVTWGIASPNPAP